MVCKDTLRIKNLPKELSDSQKEDFVRHFGATKVKVITSRVKEQSLVYAKFESSEVAKSVLLRLHQITVLNSRLCVEYAENDVLQGKPQLKKIEESDVSNKRFFKTFLSKINALNDSVGFHQPPPSHLKYNYPKANRLTINNIAHALATVPRFYTQVLHLMNKMNLPPPFAMPDPPVRTITPSRHPVPQRQVEKTEYLDTNRKSSSESELESEGEDKGREIIPMKRKMPQKKVMKRPKFIKPPVIQPVSGVKTEDKPDNVFEKVDVQLQRKIELKVPPDALEQKSEKQEPEKIGSFGLHKEETSLESLEVPKKQFISLEELISNQISPKDFGVLPVFKDYHPGVPTNKLYIKNCAKSVVLMDLEYIYSRYKIESSENKLSQFNIRLMQEGRMKGQAFVTLDSVELAQKAVKETNGYILKEKPLVVVFAKSAVAQNK